MKIIAFDCDGVLRDLNVALKDAYGIPYPTEWNWTYENLNIFEWMAKDLSLLSKAPKTKYFDAFIAYSKLLNLSGKPVQIWTNQPEEWRDNFWLWVMKNIDPHKIKYEVKFLERKQKFNELNKSPNISYLVEDHPFMPVSSKIIFIDHPYNQNSKQPNRVKSVEDLKTKLGL
jgi:hypothetical protein